MKNNVYVSNIWIPEWTLLWKIKIQLYKTMPNNDHVLWKEEIVKANVDEFQSLDYSSSRGSRDVTSDIEVFIIKDIIPENYKDEIRVVLLGKKVNPNRNIEYKINHVFRIYDKNGNYHHTILKGHF